MREEILSSRICLFKSRVLPLLAASVCLNPRFVPLLAASACLDLDVQMLAASVCLNQDFYRFWPHLIVHITIFIAFGRI